MKYTLLEITQNVLSSMDSDEINSIGDSVEAQQVVQIIRNVYFDLINRANLPEHSTIVNLQASGDSTKPVIMYVPADVTEIEWVLYDKHTTSDTDLRMSHVTFLPVEEFFQRMYALNASDTTVDSFAITNDGNTFTVLYKNDQAPQYYTTFDDSTLIFDSYDNTLDTTLQASKSLARGKKQAVFTSSDDFIPELDEPQFQLLINEAKSLAWAELKQATHAKAEQNSRRAWVSLQKSKSRTEKLSDLDALAYFGRK